jgi:hypothetical protein
LFNGTHQILFGEVHHRNYSFDDYIEIGFRFYPRKEEENRL